MCYFLTILTPANAGAALRDMIPRGLELSTQENGSLRGAIGNRYSAGVLTSGGCSCDLYHRAAQAGAHSEADLIAKFSARGWSQAKIERALRDRSAHSARTSQSAFTGLRPDIVELIQQAVDELTVVGVYAHFYRGRIDTEALPVERTRSITSQEPLELDEHELLWVKRRR